jgi:two-component system, sensor histidine kinase and response regulator
MSTPTSPSALDREVALSRVGGDLKLLREIAALFLENYTAWLNELREAAGRHDAVALASAAHGLKGSVANFGARDVVEAALHLEKLSRDGQLDHDLMPSLEALETALAVLRPELEAL